MESQKFINKKTGEILIQIPLCNIGDFRKLDNFENELYKKGLKPEHRKADDGSLFWGWSKTDTLFRAKHLVCGCCGDGFQTWVSYEDQGQDVGYGICIYCQEDEKNRYVEFMDEQIKSVMKNLKPENQEKFKNEKRDRQEAIIHELINKGVLAWTISK